MRYLSVCSGIEAASVAWHPLGWEPVAFSEIEPFPCKVLAHHYPNVPNWGDMTKFQEWPDANVDVLVGGTPCQSFSVAGLRKGLDDPRGNLMLTYLAIAAKYRPEWLAWENVPGVLSSNGGRDFGSLLGGLAELGYGFAYRVLDAQYFGVAQRRRRVFVVGCLGSWQRAAAVLFERESLSGHPAPSRKAGKVAPTIPSRSTAGGGLGTDFDCDGGLIPETVGALCADAHPGGYSGQDAYTGRLIPEITGAITARFGGSVLGAPEVDANLCIPVAHTLRGEGFDASEDGPGRGTPIVPVAYGITDDETVMEECLPTMTTPSASGGGHPPAVMSPTMQVRRLTPLECERLQGFPDSYTDIKPNGKPTPDGPRYKALGNSMAVPVMRWIGERVSAAASIETTEAGA